MSAPHVTSEQLALLAMDAEVDDAVAAHVAACPACSKDLSMIQSLLNADGPDTDASPGDDTQGRADESDLPAAAFTAMADAADGRDPAPEPDVPASTVDTAAAGMGRTDATGGRNVLAVVAVVIIAAALIVLAVLLWR